ncbi:hypothetical protein Lal_00027015 [Lupinus albus]|nr:hypothetical protein Lal_00027015 [Lupinus albus]
MAICYSKVSNGLLIAVRGLKTLFSLILSRSSSFLLFVILVFSSKPCQSQEQDLLHTINEAKVRSSSQIHVTFNECNSSFTNSTNPTIQFMNSTQDKTSPFYVHPSGYPVIALLSPPTQWKNYQKWSRSMRVSLISKAELRIR